MDNKGISTKNFVKSMVSRWVGFGVVPNEPLKIAWKAMAKVLNRHINGMVVDKWDVLKLPTGSGKTQGLIVYCSELVKKNKNSGVLIVTRFTKEADNIAKEINKISGKKVAYANHSKNKSNKVNPEDAQILIVTHSLFSKGLKLEADNTSSIILERVYKYKNKNRSLTVIDETLGTVDQSTISLNDLRIMRGAIPYEIEQNYKSEVSCLDALLKKLFEYPDKKDIKYIISLNTIDNRYVDTDAVLSPLFEAMSSYYYKKTGFRKSLYKNCLEIFEVLINLASSDGLYFNRLDQHEYNTANIALPTDIKNLVVLDATALQSYAYSLLGHFIDIHEMPEGIRSYKNVNLNIMYGVNNGKASMVDEDPEYFLHLVDSLPLSSANKKILLCVHKDTNNEDKLGLVKKKYPHITSEHWGNIDGKNNWKKHDTVIVCGLSRMGGINAECATMAFVRWHKKAGESYNPKVEYMDDNEGGGMTVHEDFDDHIDYERGHVAVGVIQAINRVRCRTTIDTEGNCKPVNAYVFLKTKGGLLEEHLLNAIKQEMPNINIIEHEADINKIEKITKGESNVMGFLKSLKVGEHSTANIIKELERYGIVKQRTFERYMEKIRKEPSSLFSITFANNNLKYLSVKGREGSKIIKS